MLVWNTLNNITMLEIHSSFMYDKRHIDGTVSRNLDPIMMLSFVPSVQFRALVPTLVLYLLCVIRGFLQQFYLSISPCYINAPSESHSEFWQEWQRCMSKIASICSLVCPSTMYVTDTPIVKKVPKIISSDGAIALWQTLSVKYGPQYLLSFTRLKLKNY